jgi:hypothetical protein
MFGLLNRTHPDSKSIPTRCTLQYSWNKKIQILGRSHALYPHAQAHNKNMSSFFLVIKIHSTTSILQHTSNRALMFDEVGYFQPNDDKLSSHRPSDISQTV